MSEMTKFSIKTYRELLHLFLNDGILIAQGHHAKTQNSKPREWAFLMDLINHVQHPQITKKTIGLKTCFFKHLPYKNNIQHGLKQTTQCQSGGLWIVRSIYIQCKSQCFPTCLSKFARSICFLGFSFFTAISP
jgi:hypothetical protein